MNYFRNWCDCVLECKSSQEAAILANQKLIEAENLWLGNGGHITREDLDFISDSPEFQLSLRHVGGEYIKDEHLDLFVTVQ